MRWTVEFSEKVRMWYVGLTPEGKAAARHTFSRLEAAGHMLGMPLSKHLGDGSRELRFPCEGVTRRVTYTLNLERKAVTLTTFRKQRQNERAEVLRARRALAAHEAERVAAEETKSKKKGK